MSPLISGCCASISPRWEPPTTGRRCRWNASPGLAGPLTVTPVPVPHDCIDGFLGAFWRRPEAYLDPVVRAGISGFGLASPGELSRGLARLEADLESGVWSHRHQELLAMESADLGYRLVVADWGVRR